LFWPVDVVLLSSEAELDKGLVCCAGEANGRDLQAIEALPNSPCIIVVRFISVQSFEGNVFRLRTKVLRVALSKSKVNLVEFGH